MTTTWSRFTLHMHVVDVVLLIISNHNIRINNQIYLWKYEDWQINSYRTLLLQKSKNQLRIHWSQKVSVWCIPCVLWYWICPSTSQPYWIINVLGYIFSLIWFCHMISKWSKAMATSISKSSLLSWDHRWGLMSFLAMWRQTWPKLI